MALSLTSAVGAQSPPDNPPPGASNLAREESDRLAREHFQTGRTAFAAGDFETAAREFQQAYDLSSRSTVLFNIGTAHERLHNWPQARQAFQRYLRENPDSPDRAVVVGRLRLIETELNRTPTTRVVVVERTVPVEDPARPFRILFFVGAGLSTIVGGGTLAIGLLADRRYNTLASTCAPRCAQDDIDDMRLRQNLVNGGLVTASVFAASTITFYVLDMLRTRTPPRRTSPAPIPDSNPYTPPPSLGFAPLPGGGILTLGGAL